MDRATFELFGRVIEHWATTRGPAPLMITTLRNLVILFGRSGREAEAVELWAAVRNVDSTHPSYGIEADRLEVTLLAARERLGAVFDEAGARGRAHAEPSEVAALAGRLCREASTRAL